jgi:hypothetical protein
MKIQNDTLKLHGKVQTKIEFLFDRIRGELHSICTKNFHNKYAIADALDYLNSLEDEIKLI